MKFALAFLITAAAIPQLMLSQGGFQGPGRYEITNVKSGRALDGSRGTLTQSSPRESANQTWEIQPAGGGYTLRTVTNGNALEPTSDRNSTPVRVNRFNGDQIQQWRFETGKDGNLLIISSNGKVLDVPDGSSRDGLPLQMYDKNGDSNQRFMFRRIGLEENRGRGGRFPNAPGNSITCSSDNGDRVYCDADTRGGVQMIRQISGSPCRQGQTWGYDGRGIWVDRGCRAEFQLSARGDGDGGRGRGGSGSGGGSVITCSSNNGERVYCDADTRRGVRIVKQRSGSPCDQGRTWGFDRRGIWVDRGCRADFQVGY